MTIRSTSTSTSAAKRILRSLINYQVSLKTIATLTGSTLITVTNWQGYNRPRPEKEMRLVIAGELADILAAKSPLLVNLFFTTPLPSGLTPAQVIAKVHSPEQPELKEAAGTFAAETDLSSLPTPLVTSKSNQARTRQIAQFLIDEIGVSHCQLTAMLGLNLGGTTTALLAWGTNDKLLVRRLDIIQAVVRQLRERFSTSETCQALHFRQTVIGLSGKSIAEHIAVLKLDESVRMIESAARVLYTRPSLIRAN